MEFHPRQARQPATDNTASLPQARVQLPFGWVNVFTCGEVVIGIEPVAEPLRLTEIAPERGSVAALAVEQLQAFVIDAQVRFDLPLAPGGTPHQQKVWQAMLAIQPGQALTYGEVARNIGSAPRAVGGACGRNPIAIVIPCHRIVAQAAGQTALGGFMRGAAQGLAIKRWLLAHEGYPWQAR